MATQLAEQADDIELPANDEAQSRDYEAEARAHGWKPLEEFPGDPAKHIDAETFVKRADEVMPLLKKQNASLKRDIEEMRRDIKRLTKAEQSAYESALADIKRQQEEAVELGDVVAFKALDKRADALKQEIADDIPSGEDPAEQYASFREEHTWYDRGGLAGASEIEMNARAFADITASKWAAKGLDRTLPPSEFFAKVAAEVEAKFPLLKAVRAKPVSEVAGATRAGTGSKAKTGANLPADAKAQATRFYNQGIIKAESLNAALDKYAKSYDWTGA